MFLSARRFKTNIANMGDASEALLALRLVTFHYKPGLDKTGIPQSGLITEEVAKVNPDLVTHDANGNLSTVRYEAMSIMLLNEFIKEHRKVEKQSRKMREQEATINELQSTAIPSAESDGSCHSTFTAWRLFVSRKISPLFKLTDVLVHFDHVARCIVQRVRRHSPVQQLAAVHD